MLKAEPAWTSALSSSWLSEAVKSGKLGFYTLCEVTHVFGYADDAPAVPANVFTILVLEDRLNEVPTNTIFLNKDRIELKSLHGDLTALPIQVDRRLLH